MFKGVLFAVLALLPIAGTVDAVRVKPPPVVKPAAPKPVAPASTQRPPPSSSKNVIKPTEISPPADPPPLDEHAAPFEVREAHDDLPSTLALGVVSKANGFSLEAKSGDGIVILRRGDVRATGAGEAALLLEEGLDTPIIVESTLLTTGETSRAIVRVKKNAKAWSFSAVAAEPPEPASAHETKRRHVCTSQHDGFGGFTVVCRVEASASGVDITDEDYTARVTTYARTNPSSGRLTTLLRFDFDAHRSTVEARVLGYNDDGTGVVVRAEMSWFPDEKAPTMTILSAERAQPAVPRIFRRPWGKMRPDPEIDLL